MKNSSSEKRKPLQLSARSHLWVTKYQSTFSNKGLKKPSQAEVVDMLVDHFDKPTRSAERSKEQILAALPDLSDEQITLANQFLQWVGDDTHEDAIKGLVRFVKASVERHANKT